MAGYLQEADRWLDVLFRDHADGKLGYDEMKREIRNRILESYKNGLNARGQSPAPRKEQSRRFDRQAQRAQ